MIDFPGDDALMTAGLEAWPNSEADCPPEWKVDEERLSRRLGVDHFRLPPDYRDNDVDPSYVRQHVPFVRFPRWHYCPDRNCGQMQLRSLYGSGSATCRNPKHNDLPERRRPRLIPVRFVAVCPKGHIEDVPFMLWAHRGKSIDNTDDHKLTYRAGRSAALAGIRIKCSCGKFNTLGGISMYSSDGGGPLSKMGHQCLSGRPWLGEVQGEGPPCTGHLRVVQRGGSNVYFPVTYSSIYLPLWAENSDPKIVKTLEDPRVWDLLTNGLADGERVDEERCKSVAFMRHVDAKQLRIAAQKKLDDVAEEVSSSEEEYRYSEYVAFKEARGGPHTDLYSQVIEVIDYASWMHPYFERVCLIRKLKETRVLAGFTRLLPPQADDPESGESQPLARYRSTNWLPAMIVRGEGIFIEFSTEHLKAWSEEVQVKARIKKHADAVNAARLARGLAHEQINPKFVLLHTFAHMLIKQLSYDCGYGSAALRERLYCNFDSDDEMQGILIYTAAGDSEGTMGGLVRQGEPGNFENTILRAIRSAKWCSSDPVCAESPGQGTDNANMAACHACALLPETSCEKHNGLLDRLLISNLLPGAVPPYFNED
jgi:hypothetical protein